MDMHESAKNTDAAKLSTTRIYHSYPGATYALPADEEERLRLTDQHQFLKHTFGGKILLAPVALQEGDEVLDACTGTGIWLLELAKDVSGGVQLQGFDIESRLFPQEASLPENLKFSINSVLTLPSEWTNRFAVVHQRLLVMGLRREEWPLALRELHRVTKPGGWAELCEFAKWGGGPANDECWELGLKVVDRMGFQLDCGQHLESMMREAGFEDVQMVVCSCPIGKWGGEQGVMQQRSQLRIIDALKPKIVEVAKDLVKSKEDFDKLMDDCVTEYDNLQCTYEWVICFGRKAL